MALEGFARERTDAMNLNEVFLATGDRYRGGPLVDQPAPKEVEYYKWSFNKDIRLTDESAKNAKSRPRGAAVQPPPADTPPATDPASAGSQSAALQNVPERVVPEPVISGGRASS
jgi:hypothetical protein